MMSRLGLPLRSFPGLRRLSRFAAGSLVILVLLSGYCLNSSHRWKEGVGALPKQHIGWLPASAFQDGSVKTLWIAVALLIAVGVTMRLRRKAAGILLSGITAVAAVTSLAVIGQRLSPRPFPVFDLTGFFPYENHFAAFANLILPVGLCLGMRHRIRAFQNGKVSSPSGLFFGAVGLMCAAIVFSGSRAGLLIACVISGMAFLLQVRMFRHYPEVASLLPRKAVQGTGVAVALLLIPALIYLVSQLRRIGGELSFRRQVLQDTFSMWKENPFWGTGPGTFSSVFPYYQSLPAEKYSFLHAHCEPLQFLAEYGVLGCAVLLAGAALILFPWRVSNVVEHSSPSFMELEGAGLGLALTGAALHCLVDFPFRHPLIALLTAVWIAILAGQWSKRFEEF